MRERNVITITDFLFIIERLVKKGQHHWDNLRDHCRTV